MNTTGCGDAFSAGFLLSRGLALAGGQRRCGAGLRDGGAGDRQGPSRRLRGPPPRSSRWRPSRALGEGPERRRGRPVRRTGARSDGSGALSMAAGAARRSARSASPSWPPRRRATSGECLGPVLDALVSSSGATSSVAKPCSRAQSASRSSPLSRSSRAALSPSTSGSRSVPALLATSPIPTSGRDQAHRRVARRHLDLGSDLLHGGQVPGVTACLAVPGDHPGCAEVGGRDGHRALFSAGSQLRPAAGRRGRFDGRCGSCARPRAATRARAA